MKIGIMGSGGMGGYIGGRLALSSNEVYFIARGAHLQAIREQGLQVKSPLGDFAIRPAQATDNPAEIGTVDLVLFCVKSYDTSAAAELIKPLIGPYTAVLPVLNGIDHIEQLQAILGPDPVLGGVAVIIANISRPGVIKHLGWNSLKFGEIDGRISPRCAKIHRVIQEAGIEIEAVPNIIQEMWWKLAGMSGVGGVFTVMRGDKQTIFEYEETQTLIGQAVGEVVRVAQAKGIPLTEATTQEIVSILSEKSPPDYKPSTLVDLERGNRLETEALNGAVSRHGRQLGVPTPVNDFVYACLKPYIQGTV